MSNPTIGNESQFQTPFNILPDLTYPNPTVDETYQFSGAFNNATTIYPFNSEHPLWPLFKNKYSNADVNQYGGNSSFDITPQLYEYFGTPYGSFLKVNPTMLIGESSIFSADGSVNIPNNPLLGAAGLALRSTAIIPGINYELYPNANNWTAQSEESTNYNWATAAKMAVGFGVNILGSVTGIPQVSQASYPDFRNMRFTIGLDKKTDTEKPAKQYLQETLPGALSLYRADGVSAALRTGNPRTVAYAAASANPYGVYTVFNLDGAGKTGFGWGSHGDPYVYRNDFTSRSHVTTVWNKELNKWKPTLDPIELAMPFVGDRVNVIDYGQRSLKNIYQWTDRGAKNFASELEKTQDFIKFYFTGPKLRPGLRTGQNRTTIKDDATGNKIDDDVIVFRATLGSLSDTFNPGWTNQTMIGRADPNYIYTGYTRDLSLDFTVYATSRDELKPIWRKLNALAGYTAPTYTDSISLEGPWMRLTIGDLFFQVPVIMTSLSYTLVDGDTTWEINIEDDPDMMQVPKKVAVSCGFNIIGTELPQKKGRFYTLAKYFDSQTDEPLKGNHNWLSDFKGNSDVVVNDRWKVNDKDKGTETVTIDAPPNNQTPQQLPLTQTEYNQAVSPFIND